MRKKWNMTKSWPWWQPPRISDHLVSITCWSHKLSNLSYKVATILFPWLAGLLRMSYPNRSECTWNDQHVLLAPNSLHRELVQFTTLERGVLCCGTLCYLFPISTPCHLPNSPKESWPRCGFLSQRMNQADDLVRSN